MAQQMDELGKMFVGGLSWESTQESLCRYFSRFGEVIDCVVMKNSETGRSRGFGFVTFKDHSCVEMVLASGPHNLDSRTIDPKACNPRSMQRAGSQYKNKSNNPKIFLGGLPSNITETDLRNYFSKYGKVIEVVIMYDQERKRSRGFGFLSFETEDGVDRVCGEHYVIINGKQVECKRAEPREGRSSGGGGGGGGGGGNSGRMQGGGQWNGAMMGMGGPGMPPPPISGPPMGTMHNGMAGYQAWGHAPPQGGFGPAGPYGAPPPPPHGFQGWAGPTGAYGYGTPTPQFSTAPGYGYGTQAPFAYNWPTPGVNPGGPGPVTAAVPPPPNSAATSSPTTAIKAETQSANQVSPPGTNNAGGQNVGVKQEYGYGATAYGSMGVYSQESSGYGPTRFAAGAEGGSGSPSTYGNNFNRTGAPAQQAYHPYRRQ